MIKPVFRYDDSEIGCLSLRKWLSVDPLAAKYPGWSPYNYCKNNPLGNFDPDGKKIVCASTASKEFKAYYAKTLKYLKNHNALGPLKNIMDSKDYTVTVEETNRETIFNPKNNTISWNPHMGLLTSTGAALSPAVALVHEGDHAQRKNTNPSKYNEDKSNKDTQWGNAEEKRVITGSEQRLLKN